MKIRPAEYNDYSRIAELHVESWQYYYQGVVSDDYLRYQLADDRALIWQTRLTNPAYNQHVLVAEQNGVLCGFICVYGNHHFERGTIVENLHVSRAYQKKGLGKQLMMEAAKWSAKYFSDAGVYLEVLEENLEAKQFYLHLGGIEAEQGLWNSPCGKKVAESIIVWPSPQKLLDSALVSAEC